MFEVVVGGGAAAAMGAGAWALHRRRLRELARQRLAEPFVQVGDHEETREHPIGGARWWIAPLAGVAAWIALGPVLGASWPFAVSLALVAAILASILESGRAQKASLALETQLVDSIDLIVGALGAGAGTLDALENAATEAKPPLARHLGDVVGRLRYGDTPRQVFEDLSDRVPLESFRLFSFTILVHEETGGSLAPILSSIGRTIRDRIDLARRVRSESVQSLASVVGILFITYAIGIVTWQADPDRMEAFLSDPTGSRLAAGAVFLQAFGLLVMSRMSRIRF